MINNVYKKPLKIAVATQSISHFEVPLYRLCSMQPEIDFKVFYLEHVREDLRYDTQYQQEIHWGEKLLYGYSSTWCQSPWHLQTQIAVWKPDVIILYGYSWSGALILLTINKLWSGIPLVHRGTLNYYKDPRQGFKAYLRRPFGKMLLRLFSAHHYGGSYSKRVLTEAGILEEAMFLVPYSIDTNFFATMANESETVKSAAILRESLGWDKDTYVILYVCQHNWFKGPDIAMQVFSQLQKEIPQTRVLIVGSGRMTEEMKQYAENFLKSDTYHFAGFIPSKQTVKYYLASDIVLFTSRYETWGRAINEAMLCRRGCVVNTITPACGGLVEHEQNGFVVNDLQPESFVAALKEYFYLPEEKQIQMKEAARTKALSLSYENHLSDLKASIEYAINSNIGK